MDRKFIDPDPKREACLCGQQIQWYAAPARGSIVVLFQKNLFSFSHRFEYPIPNDSRLTLVCVRCGEPVVLTIAPSAPPVARGSSRATSEVRPVENPANLPPVSKK